MIPNVGRDIQARPREGRAPIKLDYLFGLQTTVNSNIHYIDEAEVVYPCGHNVIVYDTEKRTQKFIHNLSNLGSGGISAMATGSGIKGKLLAVAERGTEKKSPQITVYDLETRKKRRPSFTPDQQSADIISIAFSPDGQNLLTLGGAPDWVLVNWNWAKGRATHKAKISNPTGAQIYQCSFCPTDPWCVCVSGDGILKFLRAEMSEFRAIRYNLGNREPQNYLCHAWVDVRLLVGTDTGDILVFVNAEYRGVLDSSPSNGESITCLATYSKGFVAGCDQALLYVFERDEKKMYKQTRSFQIDGSYKSIKNVAISPTEDNVACTLENSQAYVLSISNSDIQVPEDMSFEPLALPFHDSAITGLDTCLRKPLVATCGLDKSVRVWNYLEKTIECIRFFKDEPYSVSLHPSGFHILVGFSNNLCLFNVLMDEIKLCKEFEIKSCNECHFSNGGHLFAAADGSDILIYQTYTCEKIAKLSGHTGKVTSINWAENDRALFSSGVDGSIFSWNVRAWNKLYDHNQKGCNYTCVQGAPDKRIFAVGSDRRLKLVSEKEEDTVSSPEMKFSISQLTTSPAQRLLFGGSTRGFIAVAQMDLENGIVYSTTCHEGRCTRMRISADSKYLFTVAEDGNLAMFEIRDLEKKKQKQEKTKEVGRLPWSDDILVSRKNLESKLKMMTELKSKVEELQHQNQVQLEQRNTIYKKKMGEVEKKFLSELMLDEKRFKDLQAEKSTLSMTFEKKMFAMKELHEKKIEKLKEHHSQKMTTEKERMDDLEEKMTKSAAQWTLQLEELQQRYESELRRLAVDQEDEIQAANVKRTKALYEKGEVQKDFRETEKLMEDETTYEFEDLKIKYDKRLVEEQKLTVSLKDQNAILRRQFNKLRVKIKTNDTELEDKTKLKENRKQRIKNLQGDIESHKNEIEDRETTIVEKEKTIQDLRKKNQELEKFKFVLDYKISELKSQNAPREKESKSYVAQLAEMSQEVRKYEIKNSNLKLGVEDCQQKLEGVGKSIDKQQKEINGVLHTKHKIQVELKELSKITDYKERKSFVKSLHMRYSRPEANQKKKKAESNPDGTSKEYIRNRTYLEKTVESLKRQIKKDVSANKRDYDRIIRENVILVREINTLRREFQTSAETIKIKEIRAEKKRRERQKNAMSRSGTVSRSEQAKSQDNSEDTKRQIEVQQEQILNLKQQLEELLEQERIQQSEEQMQIRPGSAQKLPPVSRP